MIELVDVDGLIVLALGFTEEPSFRRHEDGIELRPVLLERFGLKADHLQCLDDRTLQWLPSLVEQITQACSIGDRIEVEEIIDTPRGLRAVRVHWIDRPRENADEVTGTIVTIKPYRGFAFMRPDDGGANLFLKVREFSDYRNGMSEAFARLIPGDRVRCLRVNGHPGPRGRHVSLVGEGLLSAA